MAFNNASQHRPQPLTSTTSPTSIVPQTQPSDFPQYQATSTLYTPNSSFSPTSSFVPYLGFQTRQLRPPKSPLYVPAVLRPTERPHRFSNPGPQKPSSSGATSPLTPPSSAGNSFDAKDAGILASYASDATPRRCRLDDAISHGVTRVVTDEWSQDTFENVTGLPTRDHWKPDYTAPLCDAAACSTQFTLLVRRHHCRRCGNIFCAPHSLHHVPLDQHARFHPDGALARACACCWNDYKTWRSAFKARSGSSSTEGSRSGTATPKISMTNVNHQAKDAVVGSVPRDWNWSTF